MNIDKAWRYNQAGGLNDFFVWSRDKLSDLCDAVADKSHICSKRFAATAVYYERANNDTRFCALKDECGIPGINEWEAGK
jgi:hypothetical protein